MRITLSWLKKYLDTDANLELIVNKLLQIGLEVEEVIDNTKLLAPFTVAEIIEALPHPEADKLKVCKVNNGKEILQIVCGAPNARANVKVVLAPIGSIIPASGIKIKTSKIRNVESYGMLCSLEELGIEGKSDGIIELPDSAVIGDQVAELLGIGDPIIELAITPNRGDCLGVYGIARDLAATGIGKLKPLPNVKLEHSFISPIKVKVEYQELCPLFIGCYIKNVTNKQSPEWLQNILMSIGQQPINVIVDITNYICHSFGKPLHAYDADKLSGNILVREAKDQEKFLALNNKEYCFTDNELLVTDEEKVLGLAGVIGGVDSGCTLNSVNLFMESALCSPISAMKSGRKHNIDSAARYRFERGVDPLFAEQGLNLAIAMILEICGGEISEYVYSNQYQHHVKTVEFNLDKVKSLGGMILPPEQIKAILTNLGFRIDNDDGQWLKLSIPSWRGDICGQADIVEEVLRICGYDNVEMVSMPVKSIDINSMPEDYKRMNIVRKALCARGLNEVVSGSFMASEKAQIFEQIKPEFKIQNPISSELDYMRPTILPNLLDALKKNQLRNYYDISLFEIGPVFDEVFKQTSMAAGIRAGYNNVRNIYNDYRENDVFDIKADLLFVFNSIGINFDSLRAIEVPTWYHPGRSVCLCLGKLPIACYGEIHPKILQEFGIKNRVVAFEIYLHNINNKISTKKKPFVTSDYQAITRDYAFWVEKDCPAESIINAIKSLNEQLITNIQIFDMYINTKDPESKKSIAINVAMQSKDHTLNEEEINRVSDNIIKTVNTKTGAVLRT